MERIPETVEKYYKQDTERSTVRTMSSYNTAGHDRKGDRSMATGAPANPRSSAKVDKPCGTCFTWGHLRGQCSGFARYLILQDAAAKADDVYKQKIVANYKADMKMKAYRPDYRDKSSARSDKCGTKVAPTKKWNTTSCRW